MLLGTDDNREATQLVVGLHCAVSLLGNFESVLDQLRSRDFISKPDFDALGWVGLEGFLEPDYIKSFNTVFDPENSWAQLLVNNQGMLHHISPSLFPFFYIVYIE